MLNHNIGKRYNENTNHKLNIFQDNYEKLWMDSYCSALAGRRISPEQDAKKACDHYFEQFGLSNDLYYTYEEYEKVKYKNDT